jgi:mono/diheme cytochrome c family protein
MLAPLSRLAGCAECHRGCTVPVWSPFLEAEALAEVGPEVLVAIVARVGTGPKGGSSPMAADGSIIIVIM